MSTAILTVIVAGASVLIVAAALVVSRGSGGGKRPCGGCGRAMMPTWDHCLFCGWSPAVETTARIEITTGPWAGRVVALAEEVTSFGSAEGNSVVLPDSAVSKKHAGIRLAEGCFELADLGSTNGVYVNGARLPKKQLDDGDVIRIGYSEMVFRR